MQRVVNWNDLTRVVFEKDINDGAGGKVTR